MIKVIKVLRVKSLVFESLEKKLVIDLLKNGLSQETVIVVVSSNSHRVRSLKPYFNFVLSLVKKEIKKI